MFPHFQPPNHLLAWVTKDLNSTFLGVIFPDGSAGKKSTCYAGDTRDTGSIPGSGRSPEEGHGKPLQYSCLQNPMDGEAW